jgi:MFS family permease
MINRNHGIFNFTFLKVSFAAFLFLGGNQMTMVAFPLFMQHLDYPPAALGVATSLAAFGAMVARPLAGYLTDSKSKKITMIIGIAAYMISLLLLPITFHNNSACVNVSPSALGICPMRKSLPAVNSLMVI